MELESSGAKIPSQFCQVLELELIKETKHMEKATFENIALMVRWEEH